MRGTIVDRRWLESLAKVLMKSAHWSGSTMAGNNSTDAFTLDITVSLWQSVESFIPAFLLQCLPPLSFHSGGISLSLLLSSLPPSQSGLELIKRARAGHRKEIVRLAHLLPTSSPNKSSLCQHSPNFPLVFVHYTLAILAAVAVTELSLSVLPQLSDPSVTFFKKEHPQECSIDFYQRNRHKQMPEYICIFDTKEQVNNKISLAEQL